MKIILYSSMIGLSLFLISFLLKEKVVESPIDIQQKTSVNDDYTVYYEIIREAYAFHKPNADYPNVLKKYREAFGSVSSPLAMDVFDVLKIAIEVDSVEAMFEFSKILVKKGCEYRFFEREGLEKLKNYPSEWSDLTNLIDEVQANPNKYWNVELKEKMEILYRKDQDIRNEYVGKTEDGNNWTLVTAYQEEVKLPFLNLIKEHGMVGEKEIGVYIPDDKNETELLYQAFPGIIIVHIIQSGEHSRFTLDEIDLYHQQGYLPPSTAKYIKGNLVFPQVYKNEGGYEKTNEMIRRGAPEDSITMQVRKDWKASQNK
jgi:hypothetical protein